ncbi:Mitochondrial import receptor subunit TOM70 [Eumeta japonica]|uniref:Mitochondrial import receptor subunit TOM70 n=1 Tax=Eumeta variegata TaxID=151549 RepID=A0A4C1W035_EUMVA|nr:Mitochondrial import receptor subunit TOM70 [Eumeta japonica]
MASTGSSPFPKWQLAILLGAPLAIGLGYLYLRNRLEDPDKKKLSELTAKTTISLDKEEGKDSKATESAIDRAMKLKGAGNRAFHAGEYDKAIALYNQAIETCPPDRPVDLATFYQNRSACYEKREMWEQVKEDCTFALKLNEKYVKAFLRRSRAAEKSGDLVLALEDVTSACILERFQVQSSLINADRILKALGRQHAREALARRRPVMPSKHFIKTYFAAFSEDPITKISLDDNDIGGFAKAKRALTSQEYDSIEDACTQEIDDNGKYKFEALLLRATFYLLLGRHEDAQSDLAKVIEGETSTKLKVNALIKRASLYVQLENTESCLEDFAHAAQLDPRNSDVYHHRGQVYLLLERMDEATSEFAKAVELNPDFSIAYIQKCYADYRHAQLNKNVGALTQVRADFERAIEKFPKCAEAYILYAQVLSDQQEWGRAEALFDAALAVDSNNATLYVHKGLVQLQKNTDFDKAVKLINKAIEMDDKCDFAYETLGTIEVQRGNLKRSLELFERAIELAKTELEMTHLFSLKDAAAAQLKVSERWGLDWTVS